MSVNARNEMSEMRAMRAAWRRARAAAGALAMVWALLGCGGPGGVTPGGDGGPSSDATTSPPPPPPADGGAVDPQPADPMQACLDACDRVLMCAFEAGEMLTPPECVNGCLAARPGQSCFDCFTGPCAATCGGACLACVTPRCNGFGPGGGGETDAGPPPPPPDAAPTGCGTGMLDARIGRSCLFDSSCMGAPIICDRFAMSSRNYCTQPCNSEADCPCPGTGGDWVCALVPGVSAVQRYCRDRNRVQ